MIGIFDSGLGGLTVLKELADKLPEYDYVYLGDSARAPYGNKSQAVIYDYTRQAVDFLFKQGCGLIIIACNTASAKALSRIQQEWLPPRYPEGRVLGVVIPSAEAAAAVASNQKPPARIGVIGTRATVESGVYEAELNKILTARPALKIKKWAIHVRACPLLVPLVEEGWTGKPETRMILKKYLRPLKAKKVNALILGCTHYPFLEADIKRIMGKNVKMISTPRAVAGKLIDYLTRHPEIESRLSKNGRRVFYTTDEIARFRTIALNFLGDSGGEFIKTELGK